MCSRTKIPETPAPNNQEVEALHTLLYGISIYTSTRSFSLEGEGWDEGEYN